jgi:hypothetical protein
MLRLGMLCFVHTLCLLCLCGEFTKHPPQRRKDHRGRTEILNEVLTQTYAQVTNYGETKYLVIPNYPVTF